LTAYPSIFNDVIGPVMRGPSSSHCAASLRIGRLCRDLMVGDIQALHIEFDTNGSLAATHKSQGADMGLFGGILGWEADDERLPDYEVHIRRAGVTIALDVGDIGATHPNTYELTLENARERRTLTALSVGGGMIEIIALEGAEVSIKGDCYETLVFTDAPEAAMALLQQMAVFDEVEWRRGASHFIEVRSHRPLPDQVIAQLLGLPAVATVRQLAPVLPVLTRRDLAVPFITCEEMLAYNENRGLALWELAVEYESARGGIAPAEVYERMAEIVAIMRSSIELGLQGTEYADRILGCQSGYYKRQMEERRLLAGDVLNTVILYVTAMMEVKSAMGVIVAAPTAGACGALPGAVLGVATALDLPGEEAVRAMLAAGMIGIFIAAHATFAAEVGGCQAETGSGAGMAAAAIVSLAHGTLEQALSAASVALQNSFGLICDPIANRVEAPCLGKNVMAATNALACANMALADYDHLIPLDEVIEAMYEVGKSIPVELRCTGLGGLSTTKTAKQIEENLRGITS
jgi:L-serine dehydratase